MSNVHKTLAIIALAAIPTLCSCSSDSRSEEAANLLEQASQASAQKDYTRAFNLLDSLDTAYRDCLEQRRQGTRLRTEALRDMTLDSIAINDRMLTALQSAVDSLQDKFNHVDVAGTKGYEVYNATKDKWDMNKTGIQARLDEDAYFFIAVNCQGQTIGLNAIEACGQTARSGSHIAVENSEIMNVNQPDAKDLMEALIKAPAPVKVTLSGSKGTKSVTLDAAALEAFKATWQYAQARQNLRTTLIRRERLERQLSRLRDTLANLPTAAETASDN